MNNSHRLSSAEQFSRDAEGHLEEVLRCMSEEDCYELLYDWPFWARPKQIPPTGNWHCWLIMAGRGFGKTRTGSEWVRSIIEGPSPLQASPVAPAHVALISQTLSDVRDVMIGGDSGLLAIAHPDHRPRLEISRRRLVWPNGIVASLYSADEPDQLRGPQHGAAWGDEVAKWRHPGRCWANLMMGLRHGTMPRVVVTTTPRPCRFLRDLVKQPTTRTTRGTTYENAANLSPAFLSEIRRRYANTSLGRQELEGELLEDRPGALWSRQIIDRARVSQPPPLVRVVVAVDPPVTSGEAAAECGIIVAGNDVDGAVFVISDQSCQGLTPRKWICRAVDTYHRHSADRLVAEVNQGGDLVETLLRQEAPDLSYRAVRATRGKIIRAEPVAALYERGLVHHVGVFEALEDQLCGFSGDPSEPSPDRLDALVWAVTELALGPSASPRLRNL